MGHEQGRRVEYWVCEKLAERGVNYSIVDDWYDLLVGIGEPKIKVEVKSTHLFKRGGYNRPKNEIRYNVGQFQMKYDNSRSRQHEENVWYAFVLAHHEQLILLGFCKAKKVQKKPYVPWSEVARKQLLNIEQFIDEIRLEGKI